MSDMDKAVYDSKKALPNKLLKEDGSVTDLAGNVVIGAVDAYDNKPALPNKWLNPDGSYSTLNEIVASMIDNELFIIVDELPAVGEENKIYLLTQDDKLIEYIWVNNEWDPVGMVEFDIDNYYTKAEVTQLITASLNSAKAYADTLFNSIEIPSQVFYWNDQDGLEFWNEVMEANDSVNVSVMWETSNIVAGLAGVVIWTSEEVGEIRSKRNIMGRIVGTIKSLPSSNNSATEITSNYKQYVRFTITDDRITAVANGNVSYDGIIQCLSTNTNYSVPYTPLYDGSPATKKYVDDAINTNITQVLNGSY